MCVLAKIHRRWITLFFLSFISNGILLAQLSAKFSASPVAGCTPLVVYFKDLSTGNPTQWKWDLGNGVTSYLQNPSATYFNPGTYTIKLVIRTAGSADSLIKSSYLTVYPNPIVNFKASDSAGCFPLGVQFTDLSSTSSGSIQKWEWDFGDGVTSSLSNPYHVYTSAGNFAVTLKVTNNYGCVKTFSRNAYIKTSDGVKAGFTNNNPGQCKAPVTINFENTSTGPGVLQYTWDFGDGTSSALANPVHTYTAPGSYTVSLLTVSSQGCRDTVKKQNLISIGTINSDFVIPASLCAGQSITFSNTTTPAPGSVTWDFGDGTSSSDMNPSKTYTIAGTYTVKLVNNFGGCSDSIIKSITVKAKPIADFAADKTVSCKPFTVSFSNKSTGAIKYKWDFGDGSSSVVENPIHAYTAAGIYSMTLISANENGCTDTLVKNEFIKIQKPVISLEGLPRKGCNPLTINPTAVVTANEAITGYLWNFGDGATSTAANPVYTYTTAGNYAVTLTITTASGCTETFTMTDAVKVGNKPKANFTASPNEVCAFQPIDFKDISTGKVDQWLWNFGDGGTSTVQNPSYAYQDTGRFSVTLITWSNTCADTIVLKDIVYIKPPIARFTFKTNCAAKYEKEFIDNSIGATSWQWIFGDGSISTEQNPVHKYTKTGTYNVTLNVSNGTCTHSTVQTVQVIDEKANFVADRTMICKGAAINFSSAGMVNANIASWLWEFGDGSTANDVATTTHTYASSGLYTVSLTVIDILGCTSSKTLSVNVYGPAADFTTSKSGICLGAEDISFTNASQTDGINSLVKWVWNFGDGSSDSSASSVKHSYNTAGEYTVSLKVVDAFRCSDIITKSAAVIIAQPKADFYSSDSLSCTDKPIHFTNKSSGYDLQYNWKFGNGATSAETNPVYNYNNIGFYDISLFVTDRYGCKDSIIKPAYINISFPKAKFTVSDSVSSCPPLLVKFTNSSSDYTSMKWEFGDGNTSTLADPSHYYTLPGKYTAMLIVTGPGGCTDTAFQQIDVRGPRGSFSYKPQSGCKPLTVTFTATTLDRTSFIWDFSDGNTLATTDSIVTHTYIEPGDYVPKMILIDATGCTVPIIGNDTIRVVSINANFGVDKFKLCDAGYINYFDSTVSNDLITSWQWKFGDGKTSNEQHPQHYYSAPGYYQTQLIVTTLSGCKDTVVLNTPVNIFESPVVTISGEDVACAPARLTFSGQVVNGSSPLLQWDWTFGNGQTSSMQNPPVQLYTNSGTYTVTALVTNLEGCTTTVTKKVTINPVPNTYAGADAVVCRDNSVQLNASGAANYIWNASADLSCTNCPNPMAKPADSSVYIVTGITEAGCIKTDSVTVKVRQRFNLTVAIGDSLCAGESTRLFALGADAYTWSPATGLDNPNSATPKAKPVTTTLYTVVGKDNDNCFTETASVLVHVTPLPTVEAGDDQTMSVGSTIQLKATASNDVTSYKWSPVTYLSCTNCPDPKAAPKQTTKYTVEVKNDGGCKNVDDLTVSVICNNGNLYIPNTFSPNGDGMNEKFYPRGTGIYLIRSLRIFNRWGELVFERVNFKANDAAAGWDGSYKGQKLSTDVYIYTCEVVCENNEVLPFKGDITLLK